MNKSTTINSDTKEVPVHLDLFSQVCSRSKDFLSPDTK